MKNSPGLMTYHMLLTNCQGGGVAIMPIKANKYMCKDNLLIAC